MPDQIEKLLVVALKPEWSFLKKTHKFAATTAPYPLYKILGLGNAYLLQIGLGDFSKITWQTFLKDHSPQAVFHFGTSGALDSDHKAGEIYSITEVQCQDDKITTTATKHLETATLLTVSKPLTSPEQKQKMGAATQCQLVDMESFAIAKSCQDQKIPYQLVRSVFDDVTDSLDELAGTHDKTGNLQSAQLAKSLALNPKLIFQLPKYQKRMQSIAEKMRHVIDDFLSQ